MIERVMHLPELSLQTGRFCRLGCGNRMIVHLQREIAKQDPDFTGIVVLHFRQPAGKRLARWALEIPELFERDGRLQVAADVRRAGARFTAARINGRWRQLGLFCAIERGAATESRTSDYCNEDERKVALHPAVHARE